MRPADPTLLAALALALGGAAQARAQQDGSTYQVILYIAESGGPTEVTLTRLREVWTAADGADRLREQDLEDADRRLVHADAGALASQLRRITQDDQGNLHTIRLALKDPMNKALLSLGRPALETASQPKFSLVLTPFFRWAGVTGMINPFGLETIVFPDLLPFERPFVLAHEWSHIAGIADEGEANFVGWLTCVRADVPSQYSGWMHLYWQIAGELRADHRARLWEAVEPGPRRDVEAIVERIRRGQLPLLRSASWRVYDQYLRANRVEEGIRSYGEVLRLLLGTRFTEDGTPVRR